MKLSPRRVIAPMLAVGLVAVALPALASDAPYYSSVGTYVSDEQFAAEVSGIADRDSAYGLHLLRPLSPDGTSDLDSAGRADVVLETQDDYAAMLSFRQGINGHELWAWRKPNLIGFVPVRVG